MKKANKVILMSVLTVIACVSLITGATFALFTSESDVNIAVTSGKVDVQASISDVVMKSELAGSKGDYAALGTYTLDGSKLTVSNIAPGDYVTFKITIVNRSTVATKWQLQLVTDNSGVELFDLLSIQVEGMAGLSMVDTGKGEMSNWEALAPVASGSSQQVGELTVTIAMPTSETAQVEGECVISAKVVAIQGNAETVDPEEVDRTDLNKVYIYDLEDFEAFRDAAETDDFTGKTVYLMEGIDLGGKEWTPIRQFNGTFEGNGQVISNLKINQPDLKYAGLFGIVHKGTINKLTLNNVDVHGKERVGAFSGERGNFYGCAVTGLIKIEGSYAVAGLCGYMYGVAQNCKIEGAEGSAITGTFVADGFEGDNVGGIAGFFGDSGKDKVLNCQVSGVTISGTRKVGGVVGYLHNGSTVSGSSFTDGTITCNADDSYIGSGFVKIAVGGIAGQADSKATAKTITDNSVNNITINAPKTFTFATTCKDGVVLTSAILGNQRDCNTSAGIGYAKSIEASGNTATNVTVNAKLKDVVYSGNGYVTSLSVETVDDVLNLRAMQSDPSDPLGQSKKVEDHLTVNFAAAEYDFEGIDWQPLNGWRYNYYGNGATIRNMNMQTAQWRGGFVDSASDCTVKDFTFDTAVIKGQQASVVAGHAEGGVIENVHLKGNILVDYEVTATSETSPGLGVFVGATVGVRVTGCYVEPDCTVIIDLAGMTAGGTVSDQHLVGYVYGSVSECDVDVQGKIYESYDGLITTIYDEADLIAFRDSVNSGSTYSGRTVKLMRDVELLQHWTPIGTETNYFGGTFDGQGHTISGLDLTSTDQFVTIGSMGSMTWGLFGCTGQSNGGTYSSMVKNIKLTGNIDLDIPSSSTMYMVGLVCGSEGRDFENIWMDFNCKISGSLAMFAPIYSCANVKECIVTGTYDIESVSFAASLIAGQAAQSMDKCVFAGTMSIQSELPLYTELGLATLGCPSVTSSYFADCSAAGVVVKGTLTKELFENAFADTDWEWNEELSQPQWKQ